MPPSPVAEKTCHRITYHAKGIAIFSVCRCQQRVKRWWKMPKTATVLASILGRLRFERCVDPTAISTRPTAKLFGLALQPVVTHAPKANILFDLAHGNAITRVLDNLIVSKGPCDEALNVGAPCLWNMHEGKA